MRHENVRLMVSQAIYRILRKLVSKSVRVGVRDLKLLVLEKFLESEDPEQIVMLMPQEVVVGSERYRVDAVFSGKIAFDFKSREGEFNLAVDSAKTKYLPKLPRVEYYVVTNWDFWRVYRVLRIPKLELQPVVEGGREEALTALEQVVSGIEELKVPPHPLSIEKLYTVDLARLRTLLRSVLDEVLNSERVKPLFEAYRRIVETLYAGNRSSEKYEEFLRDLYVKHTLMHMMVMASLAASLKVVRGSFIDICSGVVFSGSTSSLDVALPYLNWWKVVYDQIPEKLRRSVGEITENIAARAYLVDWDLGGGEDVFRRLYEVLVEPETRRKIGEYYTPIWLVDRVLHEFKLKNKLVMDPFCGSGTFLVRAFYRKLSENVSPDQAYGELVGFDINPLAVAIARAELVIAYMRATSKLPQTPPRVYHADTLAAWFSGEATTLVDPEYSRVVKSLESYISAKKLALAGKLAGVEPGKIVNALSKFEQLLAVGVATAIASKRRIEDYLREFLLRYLREDDLVENLLRGAVTESSFIENLAELVKKYGNGVWSVVLASSLSLTLLGAVKPHIIVTNPPWIPIVEYRASYSSKIHEQARAVLRSTGIEPKKAADIANGSDIACMALFKALKNAREGVGFVTYREQSFWSKTSVRAGIITTYAVLKNTCSNCLVKFIEIDFDAFGHGLHPTLVIALKNAGGESGG
ncbi:MAG: N-6 DNA methylase [Sulfolobales archaeon]|nr:N-6 DNA methylase [Sulfolobales archaeon]MDW8083073.1 N-6 DNA methylase [Sulfolobales archaeon]